jgi:hypothetical protein
MQNKKYSRISLTVVEIVLARFVLIIQKLYCSQIVSTLQ